MTEKDLKKLNRRELLEMLLSQMRRTERLEERLEAAEEKLSERESAITDTGELNDSVLKLTGMFDSARKAADEYIAQGRQYLANAEAERDRILKNADEEAGKRIRAAEAEAKKRIREADAEAERLKEDANSCCIRLLEQTAEEMERSLSILRPGLKGEDRKPSDTEKEEKEEEEKEEENDAPGSEYAAAAASPAVSAGEARMEEINPVPAEFEPIPLVDLIFGGAAEKFRRMFEKKKTGKKSDDPAEIDGVQPE